MNDLPALDLVRIQSGARGQRLHKVDTRWDDLEYASLIAASQATGLTRCGYIRATVLGSAGRRAQRAPSFDVLALARATAALNKAGGNLNAIARTLHAA